MDKILQQIVWKLTSDDAEKFLLLADIIKGRVSERGRWGAGGGIRPAAQKKQRRLLSAVKYAMLRFTPWIEISQLAKCLLCSIKHLKREKYSKQNAKN